MAQLCPQAFYAFYDSLGCGRVILAYLHTGVKNKHLSLNFPSHTTRIKKKERKEKIFP
jgi:hypothetical protein